MIQKVFNNVSVFQIMVMQLDKLKRFGLEHMLSSVDDLNQLNILW